MARLECTLLTPAADLTLLVRYEVHAFLGLYPFKVNLKIEWPCRIQ
jgi:hypothetical protein